MDEHPLEGCSPWKICVFTVPKIQKWSTSCSRIGCLLVPDKCPQRLPKSWIRVMLTFSTKWGEFAGHDHVLKSWTCFLEAWAKKTVITFLGKVAEQSLKSYRPFARWSVLIDTYVKTTMLRHNCCGNIMPSKYFAWCSLTISPSCSYPDCYSQHLHCTL